MNLWSREPIIPDVPADPNQELVDGIYREYPFGGAQLGVMSLIQLVVFTVLEMKKRGVICALFALGLMLAASPAMAQSGSIYCDRAVIYDASTNGATQLVTNTQPNPIRICGFILMAGGTASVKLEYGTGTACATGETALTPAFPLIAQGHVEDQSSNWRGLTVPPAKNLCINSSAGVAVQAIVLYANP